MTDHPGVLGRLVAHLHGEVAAEALEAFRRAGAVVYDLRDDLDRVRLDTVVEGEGPWRAPAAVRTAMLCGWNAFALQLLGDHLLEADYRCEPRTVGFVVPEISEQALAYYGQVAGWFSRAQQALHNPTYELDAAVPAGLPQWVLVRRNDCPDAYLEGVTDGLERLRAHADAALGEFRRTCGDEQPHAVGRIEQVAAEAAAAADYAAGLGDGPEADSLALPQLRVAVERLYLLGQLLAMPHLATHPLPARKRPSQVAPPRRLPGPRSKDFDRWCLSDPRIVRALKKIRAANQAIDKMWAADPDPTKTLALKAEIDDAVYRDDIGYDSSHFYACPWSAVYVVKQPVRIGSRALEPLQTFTVDIGIEKGRFHRRIVAGSFYAAGRVAYWGRRDKD